MKCIGLDMDEDSLKKAEEGYAYFKSISQAGTEFMKGSAYSLPFPDNTFDLIVCSEVLEHLHKYTDAIIEINRVLKPGGKFFASVPASWPEKICWYLSKEYQISEQLFGLEMARAPDNQTLDYLQMHTYTLRRRSLPHTRLPRHSKIGMGRGQRRQIGA